MGAEEGVRIDNWVSYPPIMRPKAFGVSYAHATPPHPIVFEGSIDSLERYRGMAHYIKKLASPPDFFSNKTGVAIAPSTSTSSAAAAVITSSVQSTSTPPPPSPFASVPSAAGASRRKYTGTMAHSQRPCKMFPYTCFLTLCPDKQTTDRLPPHPVTNKAKGPQKIDRDKFADVDSPLVPRSIDSWTKALARVRADTTNMPKFVPAASINAGYALPDPNVIAGVESDTTRGYMFTAYIRLRHVLHYRLQSFAMEPLKANAWRRILGIELHPSEGDGRSKVQHQETKKDLCECIEKGGLQVCDLLTYICLLISRKGTVDISNLKHSPVNWRGTELEEYQVPPPRIAKEILWELFEVNFRFELLALDRQCYELKPEGFAEAAMDVAAEESEVEEGEETVDNSFDDLDASSHTDRQLRVLGAMSYWESSLIPGDFKDLDDQGFGSISHPERRRGFVELFRVMRKWHGVPEMDKATVEAATKCLGEGALELGEQFAAEDRLAYHYVRCFHHVYGRPPLVPHGLRS